MTALKLPEKYIRADLIYDKCIMYLWMDLYKTPHMTQGHRHKTVGVTVNTLIIIWEFLSSFPFIKEFFFFFSFHFFTHEELEPQPIKVCRTL